jgi:hypothetical protein
MAKKKTFKLSDNTIAHLVQLLQLGILTGTDIADNFRMVELAANGDVLDPTPEYLDAQETNMKKLQDEAEALAASQKKPGFGFKGIN